MNYLKTIKTFLLQFNRKGKYGIIGGSGTNCVEVINLHNRYITCSYPAPGSILAITSYQERIAFGGTSPVFNIVSFYDPKHEPYEPEIEPEYDYTKVSTIFEKTPFTPSDVHLEGDLSRTSRKSVLSTLSKMGDMSHTSNMNRPVANDDQQTT